MSQQACDVIDVLEESITLHTPVLVHLQDGRVFEDRAQQIGKYEGEDHVAFADHELTPISAIRRCERAFVVAHRY
jgi:hypothetical protein